MAYDCNLCSGSIWIVLVLLPKHKGSSAIHQPSTHVQNLQGTTCPKCVQANIYFQAEALWPVYMPAFTGNNLQPSSATFPSSLTISTAPFTLSTSLPGNTLQQSPALVSHELIGQLSNVLHLLTSTMHFSMFSLYSNQHYIAISTRIIYLVPP